MKVRELCGSVIKRFLVEARVSTLIATATYNKNGDKLLHVKIERLTGGRGGSQEIKLQRDDEVLGVINILQEVLKESRVDE